MDVGRGREEREEERGAWEGRGGGKKKPKSRILYIHNTP